MLTPSWLTQLRCICTNAQLAPREGSWDAGCWQAGASTVHQQTCHHSQNPGTKGGSYQLRINRAQCPGLCWSQGICCCCQFLIFVITFNASRGKVLTSSTSVCQALKLLCSPWCVTAPSACTGLVKSSWYSSERLALGLRASGLV